MKRYILSLLLLVASFSNDSVGGHSPSASHHSVRKKSVAAHSDSDDQSMVEIKRGETLGSVLREKRNEIGLKASLWGRKGLVAETLKLNPEISDADRIAAGTLIELPLRLRAKVIEPKQIAKPEPKKVEPKKEEHSHAPAPVAAPPHAKAPESELQGHAVSTYMNPPLVVSKPAAVIPAPIIYNQPATPFNQAPRVPASVNTSAAQVADVKESAPRSFEKLETARLSVGAGAIPTGATAFQGYFDGSVKLGRSKFDLLPFVSVNSSNNTEMQARMSLGYRLFGDRFRIAVGARNLSFGYNQTSTGTVSSWEGVVSASYRLPLSGAFEWENQAWVANSFSMSSSTEPVTSSSQLSSVALFSQFRYLATKNFYVGSYFLLENYNLSYNLTNSGLGNSFTPLEFGLGLSAGVGF